MNLSRSLQPKEQALGQGKFTANGVVVLDKPTGLTSHDVVKEVKRTLGAAKVGHSGTLDPFATGVLIILINGATKLAPFLLDQEKSYRFSVHFGVETDTQDNTGRVVATHPCVALSKGEIRRACSAFVGEIEQTVPRFSAVRVGGQRLYQLARQGVHVKPPCRTVKIKSLDLCDLNWPEVTFEVTCSKGTYVRSLGVDLALHLNCNGHVSKLRRLASGRFDLKQALPLEQFKEIVEKGELGPRLITPAEALADYPELRVSYGVANNIRQGGSPSSTEFFEPKPSLEGPYRVLDPDNKLVAMVAKSGQASNGGHAGEITFKTLRVFGLIS
ncbi:MAG: tRNA pseudouridine(55) synthase TruB [Deltaproteobacteria bacterium]|nr:tRNA pseudouridine(55) synthase TruB [Deltaproteobacteria bacterium]